MAGHTRATLAVLGSPITHSKSPTLHAAAYRALDLPWNYTAVEITGPELAGFIGSRDDTWRGLSLTMPLKRDILPLLDVQDDVVELAGGANTVLFTDAGLAGFNTDVYGVIRALRDRGVQRVRRAHVLGAGATAASVLVAVAELGAESVLVTARSAEKATPLRHLADQLGVPIVITAPGSVSEVTPDLVVSALPGHASLDVGFPPSVLATATYLDVAYDPWPTPLAARWLEAGGRVVSGLEMLVAQALGQVRVFVTGSASVELEDERAVLDAMRASVGLRPTP